MSEQVLSNFDMEQLAFIILKELGTDKTDADLIQSIRVHRKDFYEALKQIPTQEKEQKTITSPF